MSATYLASVPEFKEAEMKNRIYILLIVLAAMFLPLSAHAAGLLGGSSVDFSQLLSARDALDQLNEQIMGLTEKINTASSQMMKLGDMLICNSFYGAAAKISFSVVGIDIISIKFMHFGIWLSGIILYVIGFFIMMIASFYMFDIAFNLTIGIVLLPIALALWPFGITRDKLKLVIESILYYVGLFIFLPLGVLMANTIVITVIQDAFGGVNIKEAFDNDMADIIQDNLSVFTLTFLKVLLCYIVAIRIIPLMAGEFCEHFFGGALVGNPMNEKMTQMSKLAAKPFQKIGKYGKNVVKHQTGKKIQNYGKNKGGIIGGALERFGKRMANTRRSR